MRVAERFSMFYLDRNISAARVKKLAVAVADGPVIGKAVEALIECGSDG